MFDLSAIQAALREFKVPAWLLFDFRGSNVLARRVLDLDQKPVTSRRWAYLVPASGTPERGHEILGPVGRSVVGNDAEHRVQRDGRVGAEVGVALADHEPTGNGVSGDERRHAVYDEGIAALVGNDLPRPDTLPAAR